MVLGLFVQAGVILYPRLHPLSAFAPDGNVRALPEGIQHVFSPSRNIRNPRNLNFFYFPTIQQDHALSLMSSIFLWTMTASDPLLPMNCYCQLMHLLYRFIIPKSGACDCLFVFFANIKAEHPLGCSGRIDIYCYFSFGIYTIISSTLHSNISHKKSIVWVETFLLARRRDSCPADTLYLLMSWYCVISFFFNVFHNGEYDIIFPFFLPF